MIRTEVASQLEPLQRAVEQLQDRSSDLGALTDLVHQLSPLTALLAPFTSGAPAVRRGPGRPPGKASAGKSAAKARGGRRGPGRPRSGGAAGRSCAVIGCSRPARSKGYCAAHYQKLRMLTKTNRKPAAWVDNAPPNSVNDVILPRGRAAHKNRKQA